jgi:hypothetical protein
VTSPSRRERWLLQISGSVESIDPELFKQLTETLRSISGDAKLTIKKLESGSVKLILDVSSEGGQVLERLFAGGSLTAVLGFRVLAVTRLENSAHDQMADDASVCTPLAANKGGLSLPSKTGNLRLLLLAANPNDQGRLQLDEESREITHKIRAAAFRDRFQVIQRFAVRPDDLLQALNEDRPHIVHFSGHGNESGDIELVGVDGRSKSVSPSALQQLFRVVGSQTRLVMLNTCYSSLQARAITESVDCAVGMSAAVTDEAARIFAAAFYRALGFGRSVKEAFEQGRAALMLEGIAEDQTPQLMTREGVDPAEIRMVE